MKPFVFEAGCTPERRAQTVVTAYAATVSVGTPIDVLFEDGYGWTANDLDAVETCVTDVLADLRRFCTVHDLDFEFLNARAANHWMAEQAEQAPS